MPEHSASNASRQTQALARAERIVEAARNLLADPDNNMEIRRRYMQRVFNLDRAAEAWVALADQPQARIAELELILAQLISGLPELLAEGDLKDEEGLIGEAQAILVKGKANLNHGAA